MKEPLPPNASHEEANAALKASEKAITEGIFAHIKCGEKPITYADLFGMGIGRRSLALSSGFRLMVDQRNSLCALPLVRMQLDTALRLYAGFFVPDHQEFCRDVYYGGHINKMKSDDGKTMTDRYLVERVSERNPWMMDVYKRTSGYIHFSNHHILETLRVTGDHRAELVVGPNDFDREPQHFIEPIRCIHHLNLIIEFALRDWFGRMCSPDRLVISASEYWDTTRLREAYQVDDDIE